MSTVDNNMTSDLVLSRPPGEASRRPGEASPRPADGGAATVGFRSAKHTPTEWRSHNQAVLRRAEADAAAAQRVQRLSRSLCRNTEADAQSRQADGTRHLGGRLQEIHLLKSELQGHVERLKDI